MSDPAIDPIPAATPRSTDPARPSSKRSTSTIALVAVAVVLLAAIVLGIAYWRGSSAEPDTAASLFFRTNADQGAEAAYALTAPTFRDTTPASTWTQTSQTYRLGRTTDVDWTQRDAQGNVTTVRGALHREGLPDLPVAVDMRRIDGVWKVATVVFEAPAALDPVAKNPVQTQATTADVQPAAPVNGQASSPVGGGDTPGPVMSVPRFGPVPDQGGVPTVATPTTATPVPATGRAGPAGTSVASGQVGPTCMGQLWRLGLHTTNVDCPLYLPTRPGATEQCVARTQAGTVTGVTVTYLDYDPATRQSALDCRTN